MRLCSSLVLGAGAAVVAAVVGLMPAVAGAVEAVGVVGEGRRCPVVGGAVAVAGGGTCVGRDGAGGRVSRSRGGLPLQPVCAPADSANFPVDTRIHPGPAVYQPGGGYQHWTVDLTNTTAETCRNIHPIVVLVDRERTLRPEQIQLEFDDGTRRRPVPFERVGQGENIGVFDDDGFAGFTVEPGRTLTVKVRLAFTSDTEVGHVVASAALVQRRDDDGEWVGDSNDYPFDIVAAGPRTPTAEQLAETGPATPLRPGVVAGVVLFGGGALVVAALRLRARRR